MSDAFLIVAFLGVVRSGATGVSLLIASIWSRKAPIVAERFACTWSGSLAFAISAAIRRHWARSSVDGVDALMNIGS